MKRLNIFAIVFSVYCFQIFTQTDAKLVTVTADGYSYVSEDETLRAAKDRAMKDAERNAVEAGMDGSVNVTLFRSNATRGIGRVVKGSKVDFTLTGGKKVERVTELVTGKGALMRKISFKHSR